MDSAREALLDEDFNNGILICRLFLGLSKDQFISTFKEIRGQTGIGVKAYRANRTGFLNDLVLTGLLEAMAGSH